MVFFVFFGNFFSIFVSWEFLGLQSFFLVNFNLSRFLCSRNSIKVVLVNKTGDIFFLLVISLWIKICMSFSSQVLYLDNLHYFAIFLFLFLCCITKSAQFAFHIWLPDAMEGPIPVSSLIHAATLVLCGIILLDKLLWLNHHTSFNFL